MKEDDDLSANIKEYLENSPFEVCHLPTYASSSPTNTSPQLEDKAGNQEVILTRTFGNEKIRITFTTADLNSNVNPEDALDDQAMYDDADMDVQSGGANTKGAINQGNTKDGNFRVAPEDHNSPADREELEDDYEGDVDGEQGFPAHASIRIERPGKGALAIEATAQDGDFLIEDLYYFPDAELADPRLRRRIGQGGRFTPALPSTTSMRTSRSFSRSTLRSVASTPAWLSSFLTTLTTRSRRSTSGG